MTQFVDANIFLRYFTRDNLEMRDACARLFAQAKDGKVALVTSESIIAEIVYVLSSPRLYAQPREIVFDVINSILSLQGLHVPNRQRIVRAIYLYAFHNIDFPDALAVTIMEENEVHEIYSYDRHFDRIDSIKRIEPS